MPRILLHDASILIDPLSVDLLGVSLNLPFEKETTDFIIVELTDAHQNEEVGRQVADGKLVVVHSNDEDVAALSMFKSRHSNLSLADCSVLYWARKHAPIVLSGDNLMRKVADDQRLEVHGTIWVFDQRVEETLLRPADAAVRLGSLLGMNPRLRRKE